MGWLEPGVLVPWGARLGMLRFWGCLGLGMLGFGMPGSRMCSQGVFVSQGVRRCQVWGCQLQGCPLPGTHFQGRSSPGVPNLGVFGSQKGQVLEVLSPKVLSPGSPQHRPGLRASPGGRTALRPPPTRLLLRPQPTRGAPTEHGGLWGTEGGVRLWCSVPGPKGSPITRVWHRS